MDTRVFVISLTLATGVLLVTAAFAEESVTSSHPGYGAVARPDRTTSGPESGAAGFTQIDRNGDGTISREELDQAGAVGGTQGGSAAGGGSGTVGASPAAKTGTGESAADTTGSIGGDGSVGSRQAPQ